MKWKTNRNKYDSEAHGHGGMGVAHLDLVDLHLDSKGQPPFIGLYGYHSRVSDGTIQGTPILGGFWAGFKYIEKTQEVWFSPLSFHEVQHVMTVPSASKAKHEEAVFEDHHAQFVVRVWIIRDSQRPPPKEAHHRWTKVRKRVRPDIHSHHQWMLWKAVWEMIEEQVEGGAPYTLRL